MKYRGYHIELEPTGYGANHGAKYVFYADDYDGAPDSGDIRHGSGSSVIDCERQIRDLLEVGNE